MSLPRLLPFLMLAAAAGGCMHPIQPRSRFDGHGEIDGAPSRVIVSGLGDIRLFYGTAPDGFVLRGDDLRVEAGYRHRVVGTVQVLRESGTCQEGGLGKADILDQMRRTALGRGGNAIVYARSLVDESPSPEQLCADLDGGNLLGTGWVVVIDETPAKAAAAAVSE